MRGTEMSDKQPSDAELRRPASRPLRFTFSLLYIGIAGAITYLYGITSCGNPILTGKITQAGLLLLLLSLLGLEWFERRRYPNAPPTVAAFVLLVIRMILVESVVALDCTKIALFLYPMVPFGAHFALGSRMSTLLSLFYVLLIVWRTGRLDSVWYLDPGVTSNLLAFTFVMLFVPLIAHIIRRDDESRWQTERLLADLESSHLKLRVYAEQVAELAAAEERNRLARDIHDSLGHYLTAVNIQLEKALAYQDHDPEEATQAIRDAKQAAADALRDVRRSVSALRSPEGCFSLKTALENLVGGLDNDRIAVDFSITGDETGYSRFVLMALYRAAQEGLTNVQKHAQASHVALSVQLGEYEARLVLRDDGQGFDTRVLNGSISPQEQGFGLRGIRERLEMVRGQLALRSSPQRGWQRPQ